MNPLRWRPLTFLLTTGTLLAISGSIIAWTIWADPSIRVPQDYARKVLSPIYIPARLPVGYKIDPNSYLVREGALIMSARHENGRAIAISQQAKPVGFDFHDFYERQLTQAQTLPRTPHPSVYGTTTQDNKTTLLSIIADSTWIIVTSKTKLSEADLRLIATHLKRQ
jgi:hypothetical protein